jgi:hypothetical protein
MRKAEMSGEEGPGVKRDRENDLKMASEEANKGSASQERILDVAVADAESEAEAADAESEAEAADAESESEADADAEAEADADADADDDDDDADADDADADADADDDDDDDDDDLAVNLKRGKGLITCAKRRIAGVSAFVLARNRSNLPSNAIARARLCVCSPQQQTELCTLCMCMYVCMYVCMYMVFLEGYLLGFLIYRISKDSRYNASFSPSRCM